MTHIVVPFRGAAAKRRLEAPENVRMQLALAMLGDVLAASTSAGGTVLVTDQEAARTLAERLGAAVVPDPGGGQGAAVASALARLEGSVLVVNADLPCVTPDDLRTLADTAQGGIVGMVEAADGTTNALALPSAALFADLYGLGSARRFRAHFEAKGRLVMSLTLPNLRHDVDTLADLHRLELRAGSHTQAALGGLVAL